MTRHERPQGTADRRDAPPPTIVGIGASAGGLAALVEFFAHVPEDSGLCFVVVVHLSAERESHLAELLQVKVGIPVRQVSEDTRLQADNVYVIPPGRNLSALDTHLRLSPIEARPIERAVIDHFLRTLARTHDGHAIAVILSGTGSDGALGVKAVKEHGGLTIVQEPGEAEFDGMPQSAIASGLVDLVLPVAEIPDAALAFARTRPRVPIPEDEEDLEAASRAVLQRIFALIRARTHRDFSRYKRSTVLRRIARRMQLRRIVDLAPYAELLRDRPEEVQALGDDLLITVTNFFRDPEVFERLQQHDIPRLFEGKSDSDHIRVWIVGCATGEEAYSVAILLLEEAARRAPSPGLQVFASDLHERSLEQAREGLYTADIAVDVGHARLGRYFVQTGSGYRIHKNVRDLVVFTPHNLLGDPPFSRLDLIVCRNVLIYLQREAQRDVTELFHYALRPGGTLVLGTPETIDGTDLFFLEDKAHCVYRKRNVPGPEPRLPVFPLTRGTGYSVERHAGSPDPVGYGAVHQRMVERYAPPSLLVSAEDKVVHLSENAGRYLVHPGGRLTASVYKLLRRELSIELRGILHSARQHQALVSSKEIVVNFGDTSLPVVLHVRPAPDPQLEGFALVIFDERLPAREEAARSDADAPQDDLAELDLVRLRLQGVIEDYEASQEQMKASNEELQSANEELRSTMEELETSKEELQSMNEELQTVNQENRHKVEELAQLSNDLQNLLTATNIATLFLDRELRIMRFTPQVGDLFNVREVDRGRPISDLTHRLGYPELRDDALAVLTRLAPIEREVQDEAGRWYLTRVGPYRSSENRIAGVVITFVDITARKRAEDSLREADLAKEEFLAVLAHELRNPLATLRSGLTLLDLAGGEPDTLDTARTMMERQLEVLVRLVDDLLDVSRIRRGKIDLRRERIELSSTVRDIVAAFDAAGRALDTDLPPEPVHVSADPVRFAQLLTNLLSNARKFTEPDGRIRVGVERREDEAWISVEDDGIGIAPEHLAKIFEMFTQSNTSRKGEEMGMGVGLTLARQLAEIHGGTVEATSAGRERGSLFRVRLPLDA